jgi:hypothetical protein
MRSFFTTTFLAAAGLLSVITLSAQNNHSANTGALRTIDIQTNSTSCFGEGNGSVYAQSAKANWNMDIYRNGSLFSSCAVANRDTFIHDLPMGCYTFIYMNGASRDTISKIISAPPNIISMCRVHYLDLPGQNAVSFINLSAGAVSFDWDFGDGEHSAEISPRHVYAIPGTYTVALTARNLNNCSSVSSYTVIVTDTEETGSAPAYNNGANALLPNGSSVR